MPKHRYDQPPVPRRPQEKRDTEHHSERASQPIDAAAEVVERDLAEMDAAAKERLAREAAEPDAATAVENEAREQTIEKLPSSAQDMILATIAPGGAGVLSDLETTYVRDHEAYALAATLTQRVQRFFTANGEAAQPSFYANLVHRSLTESLNPREQLALREFQLYFTQEVNPLLQALYERAHRLPATRLHSKADLWSHLQAGEAGQQKTTSVFGVLRLLAERHPDLPALSLEATPPQQRLIVDNPLSADRKATYWQERLNVQEVYGESSLPKLITLRTQMLMYELHDAAERLPDDEQNETLRTAYAVVAGWCEQQAADFFDPTAEQPEEFGFLVRRLHFAHGEPGDVIDFLNAAEIIKRQNPVLFERMAGIGQQYFPGSEGHFETKTSDLYGSVFHLGLHRSLELTIRSNATVDALLRHRIESLTELNRPQPLLQHLNGDQLAALEAQYKTYVEAAQEGSGVEKAVSAVMAFAQSRLMFEASLGSMLEAIRTQEWDEQRAHLIERLRVSAPDDFIATVAKVPAELKDDPEFEEIFKTRVVVALRKDTHGNPEYLNWLASYGPSANDRIRTSLDTFESMWSEISRSQATAQQEGTSFRKVAHGFINNLEEVLWKSTPKEVILSSKFFELIAGLTTGDARRNTTAVLENHPAISAEEWSSWKTQMRQFSGEEGGQLLRRAQLVMRSGRQLKNLTTVENIIKATVEELISQKTELDPGIEIFARGVAPEMLEGHTIDLDKNRTDLVTRLKNGSPDDFFAAIRSVPYALKDDDQLQSAIQERIIAYIQTPDEQHAAHTYLNGLMDDVRLEYKDYESKKGDPRSRFSRYEKLLWKGVSKEVVLSQEFFDLLVSLSEVGIDEDTKKNRVEFVKNALTHHPEITREEWQRWQTEMKQYSGETGGQLVRRGKLLARSALKRTNLTTVDHLLTTAINTLRNTEGDVTPTPIDTFADAVSSRTK